jgi:hypothetical protein
VLGYVISLSLTGNFKNFKLIAIPIVLENKKFPYIDTKESMLCLDQTRQCYFMIDEADLNHCKTTTSGLYVCKQSHVLISRNS